MFLLQTFPASNKLALSGCFGLHAAVNKATADPGCQHCSRQSSDGFLLLLLLLPQVVGPKSPPSHTKIALYHYLTKSEGEYMLKMKRGSAAGNYKAPEFFYAINGLATATCTRAIPLGLKCCPSVLKELGPIGVKRVKQELQQQQQQAAAARNTGAPAGR